MRVTVTDSGPNQRPVSFSPISSIYLTSHSPDHRTTPIDLPSSPFHDDSFDSSPGFDIARFRRLNGPFGIISSETSKHYIVKSQGVFIPIIKSLVTSEDNEDFLLPRKSLKGRKVCVLKANSHQPEAVLIPQKEGKQRDLETEPAEDGRNAYQKQVALTTDLCTDIAVLTALANDPRRSEKYIDYRSSRLRKSVSSAFAVLRGNDPSLYAQSKPIYSHLLGNLEVMKSDSEYMCSECGSAKARMVLTCGHTVCVYCAEGMQGEECLVCGKELTVSDKRLVLLEKYVGIIKPKLL